MTVFVEISLIIALTAVFSAVARVLKQPLIIAYIITGLLIGPHFLNLIESGDTLEALSQFGITLLLFIVGLNLSPNVIREVGRPAALTGIGQVVFTVIIGYIISVLFGFDAITSLFISVALTFSSTIIVLKLLSDKGDLEKLYGKISIGVLLVQDLIATIILLVISSFALESSIQGILTEFAVRGMIIFLALFIVAKFILPHVIKFFAKSQEFLFLFSIAWGMGLASAFQVAGFSMEIGALIAGVILSLFPYNYEISAKMKPLRDFFLILFFIVLGSGITFDNASQVIIPAIVFSVFVLVGNPLIVLIVMGILRYPRRVGFMTGLTLAQISEFSLILMKVGEKGGYISSGSVVLVTIVGLVTIAGSSYLMIYSEKIFPLVSGMLKIFERSRLRGVKSVSENYDVVLFGYNRIGYDFVKVFKEMEYKFLVVDFDPDVIESLESQNIPFKYGDAGDDDLIEDLNLKMSQLIVSTVPDYETNAFLISKYKSVNPRGIAMVISHHIKDAKMLYQTGADYVIMPHFLGGKYASMMAGRFGFDRKLFEKEKNKHMQMLEERELLGHDHPNARQ